jgi:tocopherol cyclase
VFSASSRLPAHSGYHWDGSSRRFFEGWYCRLTLPQIGQSFAFMYSIDDPGGGAQQGGAAQILGPDGAYFSRALPDRTQFWAWKHSLGLGHWNRAGSQVPRWLSPSEFAAQVSEGYQLTAKTHQGQLWDGASQSWIRWQHQIKPCYGWGATQATAGWLSFLPIFEPGWQVLIAHGWATGWMDWRGQRYQFERVPLYAEKNWGGAFPQKWFWIQANSFDGQPDLSLTAAAGVRQVLGRTESVGLVGLHWDGKFYEFVPWTSQLSWRVSPWGQWWMRGSCSRTFTQIELTGTATDEGAWVRVPTRDGMLFRCRDTTQGNLQVKLWDRGALILEAQTNLAGLEVGGGPWEQTWERAQD